MVNRDWGNPRVPPCSDHESAQCIPSCPGESYFQWYVPVHSLFNMLLVTVTIGMDARMKGTLECANKAPTCAYDVILDGGTTQTINSNMNRIDNTIFYQTPTLEDGSHELQLVFNTEQFKSIHIDFALVNPSNSTNLRTALLYANYTDPSIEYMGNWSTMWDGRAIATATEGDSFRFAFAGSFLERHSHFANMP